MAENDNPNQSRQPQLVPFTVEFGDHYLRNHTVNTPPFQGVVRGEFSIARLAQRPEGMRDVGNVATKIPAIPGMRLSLDVRRKTAKLFDPCDKGGDGEAALEAYNNYAKTSPALEQKRAVPAVEHKISDDQIKTLLIELRQKLKTGNCRITDGEFPSDAAIDSLPGKELYDPWNQGRKPKYKDQLEEWEQSAAARV